MVLLMYPTAQPRAKSDIQALLVRAGITPTAQRLEIACVILNRPQHLSAEQILHLVNRAGNSVSKATVYNTLGLFARKGIVREVLVDPNRVFFDSNIDEHYHLYNEDTGTLTDIYADCLQPDALPTLPKNTTLVGIDVIIRIRNN
jgi:Fur family iron response transcriptional regulator